LYFDNDIHLAPITSGGGLKLKIAIPLWNGLRVVSTLEGANGFNNSLNLKVASTPELFASSILEFLATPNNPLLEIPRSKIYSKNQQVLVEKWLDTLD
jgi:hypothetical protein